MSLPSYRRHICAYEWHRDTIKKKIQSTLPCLPCLHAIDIADGDKRENIRIKEDIPKRDWIIVIKADFLIFSLFVHSYLSFLVFLELELSANQFWKYGEKNRLVEYAFIIFLFVQPNQHSFSCYHRSFRVKYNCLGMVFLFFYNYFLYNSLYITFTCYRYAIHSTENQYFI